VWLGTSDRALVFRFDPKLGKARAMADFAGNEVSSLAAFRDGVIAAANDLAEQPPPTGKTPAQVEAAEKPNAAKGQVAKPPEVGSRSRGQTRTPDPGDRLWAARAPRRARARCSGSQGWPARSAPRADPDLLTSVRSAPDGTIYAGAARRQGTDLHGRSPRLDRPRVRRRRRARCPSCGSTTNFLSFHDRHARGGLSLDRARASQARYVATSLDAKAVSRFGKYDPGRRRAEIKLETRSGNTAKPGVGLERLASAGSESASSAAVPGGREGRHRPS